MMNSLRPRNNGSVALYGRKFGSTWVMWLVSSVYNFPVYEPMMHIFETISWSYKENCASGQVITFHIPQQPSWCVISVFVTWLGSHNKNDSGLIFAIFQWWAPKHFLKWVPGHVTCDMHDSLSINRDYVSLSGMQYHHKVWMLLMDSERWWHMILSALILAPCPQGNPRNSWNHMSNQISTLWYKFGANMLFWWSFRFSNNNATETFIYSPHTLLFASNKQILTPLDNLAMHATYLTSYD